LYSQLAGQEKEKEPDFENDEYGVKIYDRSVTSPFNQLKAKTKTMDEAINESEKRKAKNVMAVNLHKKH
jgi:hypothetical protein